MRLVGQGARDGAGGMRRTDRDNGAAMAGSWAFSSSGFWPREGSNPQLAMAPDGEAVVVDEDFETIHAWRHTPEEDFVGGTFGEPVSPEESICCRRPEAPSVAIDPKGDIVIVWQEEIGNSGETGVYTSFRPRARLSRTTRRKQRNRDDPRHTGA